MKFQVGQIVQWVRAVEPEHEKLVRHMGEVEAVVSAFGRIVLECDYIVYFPGWPSGICERCNKHHDPLVFMMAECELKAIDDPDQGKVIHTDEQLPEELEA